MENHHHERSHAICMPFPTQGHISAMLNLSKLLHHHHSFHITFVLTTTTYTHITNSTTFQPPSTAARFRFETISDGLPAREGHDSLSNIEDLCHSTAKHCYAPFRELIERINKGGESGDVPPVSCVVADCFMTFAVEAAQDFGIPVGVFWSFSAAATMVHLHCAKLRDKLPKHPDAISGDYTIDWIPGIKSIRVADIPDSAWTPNPRDAPFFDDYMISEVSRTHRASALIIHTFDDLELEVCNALSSMFNNRVYTIGPIPLLLNNFPKTEIDQIGCHLWEEDRNCIEWLDSKPPKSVVYVNFGSLSTTTSENLVEFAMGLKNSMQDFLWVVRPELVSGEGPTTLLPGFREEVEGRGYITGWCDQERVLNHRSVGGFLTHCGWNSVMESICAGVPMACWSVFADQPLNRVCCCSQWGIGLEIGGDEVKRGEVESVVRELMEGERGKEVRNKAMFWKERAKKATSVGGSSFLNLENLIGEVLLFGGPHYVNGVKKS